MSRDTFTEHDLLIKAIGENCVGGQIQELTEVISEGNVMTQIMDVKCAVDKNTKALNKINETLDRICVVLERK